MVSAENGVWGVKSDVSLQRDHCFLPQPASARRYSGSTEFLI